MGAAAHRRPGRRGVLPGGRSRLPAPQPQPPQPDHRVRRHRASVVLLAALPDLFDPVFDTFNFAPGNNRRIIAVLVAAVVVLFLMLFRLQGHSDQSERAIRQLVEALGVERFDWDEAAARVAGGPKIVTISPAFNEAENVGAVIEAMPKEVAGYRGDPDRGGRLLRRRHRRGGACGRSAGRPPADPPRRWPRAPRGLRHRVEAGRRHRRHARRRRPAPARGDPHPGGADHRGSRRPRERLAHAGRLRRRPFGPVGSACTSSRAS